MNKDIDDNKYEKLKDQFTTPTRNVRRNLLAAASLSIVLVLINAKIDGLFGIKFDKNVPIFIPLGALYLVVLYEFIAFTIYGIIDFKSWHLKPFEKTHQFKENKIYQLVSNLEGVTAQLQRNDLTNVTYNDIGGHPMPFHIDPMPLEPLDIAGSDQHRLTEEKVHEFIQAQQQSLDSMVESEVDNFKVVIAQKLEEANSLIKSDIENIQNSLNTAKSEVSLFKKEIETYHSGIKGFNFIQRVRIYAVDWGVPLILGGLSLYLNFDSVILFIKEVGSKLLL